ncbi:uncharacterized protein LOC111488942 isoform X2 [Cucurbita maxima]|uniref:Uncharacterized protein LOC111488942 isoform X2 n=1 Tax=Cucurbita maxima TaxID=3661 RepID=A0A6J1JY58_CUCMA|nr:uncharacterized protein LOC111488942 isoform X2 [Cucurbita maxima]
MTKRMESYGLLGQRRDVKHKGRNVVWSVAMDKCLIEALAVQARNGNKIERCFNENAYTAACVAVNSHFNLNLNNQKVINRLKTIKKRYKVIKDILCRDGFQWNPTSKMIDCDSEELWKRYVAAPSRWTKMKDGNRPLQVRNFVEESASFHSPSSEDLSETDDTESYTGPSEYAELPNGSQDPLPNSPQRQHPKRPRASEALQDAMLAVASSIRRLADAMELSKHSIDANELLEAVMEIDGLEEAKQMYAFEYLNANPVKARAFLTYNARMRKIYLFRQFWWWK